MQLHRVQVSCRVQPPLGIIVSYYSAPGINPASTGLCDSFHFISFWVLYVVRHKRVGLFRSGSAPIVGPH